MSSQGSLITASLIPGFAGHLDPQHPYDVILAVPPEHYIVFLDGMAFPLSVLVKHRDLHRTYFKNMNWFLIWITTESALRNASIVLKV
jgi:hypothetical protein